MEKTAYILLSIVALCWLIAIIIGVYFGIIAFFPFGLIGLLVFTAFGLLFIKVIKERIKSKEDDYYSKKIDK